MSLFSPTPLSLDRECTTPQSDGRSHLPRPHFLIPGTPTSIYDLSRHGRCLYFYGCPSPSLEDRPHDSWLPLDLHRGSPSPHPTPHTPLHDPRASRSPPRGLGSQTPPPRSALEGAAKPRSPLTTHAPLPSLQGPERARLPGRSAPRDPNFLGRREAVTTGEEGAQGWDGGLGRRVCGPHASLARQGTRSTCSSSSSADRLRLQGPMAGRGRRARAGAGCGRVGPGWIGLESELTSASSQVLCSSDATETGARCCRQVCLEGTAPRTADWLRVHLPAIANQKRGPLPRTELTARPPASRRPGNPLAWSC